MRFVCYSTWDHALAARIPSTPPQDAHTVPGCRAKGLAGGGARVDATLEWQLAQVSHNSFVPVLGCVAYRLVVRSSRVDTVLWRQFTQVSHHSFVPVPGCHSYGEVVEGARVVPVAQARHTSQVAPAGSVNERS